jgi:hypothetical protein
MSLDYKDAMNVGEAVLKGCGFHDQKWNEELFKRTVTCIKAGLNEEEYGRLQQAMYMTAEYSHCATVEDMEMKLHG